ncbi:MAG: hypothetical protein V4717_15475 [Bacteroidota bacterium]
MLENLFNLVKEFGQQQVVENPEIPNEQNEAVMAEASQAVAGTLQSQLAQGNLAGVMDMFRSNDSSEIMSNPVAQNMQAGFMENISNKLGINKNIAAGLAATLIPMIISKLVNRTNSAAPADSGFNLNSLIGSLTGGGNGHDFSGLINQVTGNNNGGAGGLDLSNIIAQISGGANQQQQSGGLSSLINGFFRK